MDNRVVIFMTGYRFTLKFLFAAIKSEAKFCMDDFWLEIFVDFFTQVIYIYINDGCAGFKVEVPNLFDNVLARKQLVFMAHQRFHQGKFLLCQLNFFVSAPGSFCIEI